MEGQFRKATLFIVIWFLLETAAFVLVCLLTSFWTAFWLSILTSVAGYAIRPSMSQGTGLGMSVLTGNVGGAQARVIGSTLLMVPGFLTDILGILVLIPGVRTLMARGMRALVSKHVTKFSAGAAAGWGAWNGQGMQAGGRFGEGGAGECGCSPQETIDVDYEVRRASLNGVAAVRAQSGHRVGAENAAADEGVIDVAHEWIDEG